MATTTRGRRLLAAAVTAVALSAGTASAAWAQETPAPVPPGATLPGPTLPGPTLPDAGVAGLPGTGGEAGRISPGVQTFTDGAQCTANFVFTAGGATYLGQAAHCSGTGGSTETNGCTSGSLPLGTPVEIEGASQPGTLAYNSWLAMQSAGETDPDACAHNDLALIEIDPADVDAVDPSVPFFGGPTGLDTDGSAPGEKVVSYGNSSLRGGVAALSPKVGTTLGDSANGWTHTVLTATPGIPGDSGSAFLSDDGTALGVLSTLNIAPAAGTNGVSDLAKMLDYARGHGGPGGLELVTGGDFRNLGLL